MVVRTFEDWKPGQRARTTGYVPADGRIPCLVLQPASEAEWLDELQQHGATPPPPPALLRIGAKYWHVSVD